MGMLWFLSTWPQATKIKGGWNMPVDWAVQQSCCTAQFDYPIAL